MVDDFLKDGLSVVQRKDSEVEIDLREGLEAAERLPTLVIPNSHSLGSLRQKRSLL